MSVDLDQTKLRLQRSRILRAASSDNACLYATRQPADRVCVIGFLQICDASGIIHQY